MRVQTKPKSPSVRAGSFAIGLAFFNSSELLCSPNIYIFIYIYIYISNRTGELEGRRGGGKRKIYDLFLYFWIKQEKKRGEEKGKR